MNHANADKADKSYTMYTGTAPTYEMTESEIRIRDLENEVYSLKEKFWMLLIIIGALGLMVVKLMTDIEHMKG